MTKKYQEINRKLHGFKFENSGFIHFWWKNSYNNNNNNTNMAWSVPYYALLKHTLSVPEIVLVLFTNFIIFDIIKG